MGLLLAGRLSQAGLELFLRPFSGLATCGHLLVHLVLDRRDLLGRKQVVGDGIEHALLEFLAGDRLGVRADDIAEMIDRQLLLAGSCSRSGPWP